MKNAIGGYFELELPLPKSIFYPQALCFQSARAAFLALLRTGKPKCVWMPRYICDSMFAPLTNAGIKFALYSIDKQYGIVDELEISPDDWLLYVNYFGVCAGNVDRILTDYNPNQVILDCSQSFYASPRQCLASIYSPRKFFGVADGGLLVTTLPVVLPAEIDQGSADRSAHLIKRLTESPESGYPDYIRAEQSLCDFEPNQISDLTRRILMGVDFEQSRIRRNNNFYFLNEYLSNYNQLSIDLQNVDGPLCYPFMTDRPSLRECLIAERIFVPTYWPEVYGRTNPNDIENYLTAHCLPLPIDQRYGKQDMQKIIDVILH